MRLTLISYLSRLNEDFEEIAFRVVPGPAHQVRRVQTRAGLFQAVEEVAPRRHSLTRLDIHGHGAPGGMFVGDELLVRVPRNQQWEELSSLLPYLAMSAELRLLGCSVGAGPPGRELVEKLAALLGPQRVTVLAATVPVNCRHFGPQGLIDPAEPGWFRSSAKLLAEGLP